MNLAIRGIEANFGSSSADSFHDDRHPFLKADFVMANPPFNSSEWGGELLVDDPRWIFGTPPVSNANYAWIQHMLYHLNDNGRIGLVLASSSLSSKLEFDIRKNIINADLVEGIIDMPPQLFYNVKIPCCLWILSKRKEQTGKTLFIDARKLGYMRDRTHRELSCGEETVNYGNDIKLIADAFSTFREGKYQPLIGFSAIADIENISGNNFSLSPRCYVGQREIEINDKSQSETLKKSIDKLILLFSQINRIGINGLLFEVSSIYSQISILFEKVYNSLFYFNFVKLLPFQNVEQQDSFLYSIPANWTLYTFDEFIIPSNEKCGNKVVPEYSVTNRGIVPRSENYSKQLSKDSSKNKLICYGNLIFGMSREILNWGIMEDEIGGVSPAYKVYSVDKNKVNPIYLKYFISNNIDYFSDLIKPAAREGQSIDEELLMGKQIFVPNKKDWDSFVSLLNNIFNLLQNEEFEDLQSIISEIISAQ